MSGPRNLRRTVLAWRTQLPEDADARTNSPGTDGAADGSSAPGSRPDGRPDRNGSGPGDHVDPSPGHAGEPAARRVSTHAATSIPPEWMGGFLAFVERVDRRRLGIRTIRTEGALGLSVSRWPGPEVTLRDGTRVRRGDLVGGIHVRNDRVGALTGDGWQTRLLRLVRDDLVALADWTARQGDSAPVAFYGGTILWPFARRLGAEVRPRRPTLRVRMEDWYLRGVMRHWAREGAHRLELGHGALRTMDCWLSSAELVRRHRPSSTDRRP